MLFHEQLTLARKAKGMTQDQLASIMNITRQGVSRWENGKSMPDVETIKKLSHVLECNFLTDENLQIRENSKSALLNRWVIAVCAGCLVVGLAAGMLIGKALPRAEVVNVPGKPTGNVVLRPTPTAQPKERISQLSVKAEENPLKAIPGDERGIWFYKVQVKNTGTTTLTCQSIEIVDRTDDGALTGLVTFTPQEMMWGDGVFLPGHTEMVTGGFPVQANSNVIITVNCVDDEGNPVSATEDIVLLKEFK